MNVLLANDSSPHSQAAADYLLSLPFRKPIDLDIVSAVTPPMIVDTGVMGMPADLSRFMVEERELVRARVDQTADQLSGPVHRVHTHVPIGSPSTELLTIAEQSDADLIVLGAVGHSALERVLLGSVSDYVATHSDSSTLVVRPPRESDQSPELKRIVIALSGRPKDQLMVNWMRDFKFPPGVEVHLVRVLLMQMMYRQDIKQQAADSWDSFVKDAQEQLLRVETELQSMGLNTETHLVEAAHIGDAVIDYTEEHGGDLVITGDSDSGMLTRVFLGSTSRYVLRHARCSVLIVRDKEDRRDAKRQAVEKSSQTVTAG